MSRFRHGSDAGVITPRSAAAAPPPPSRSRFARLVGAVGMLVLTALLFWLLTDDTFRVSEASVSFRGLQHADETAVRARLTGLDRSPNVFRVRATDIVSELSQLTEVDAASASVSLPASVSVHLDERDPLFVWSNGQVAWLVDEEGMLFAPSESAVETDGPGASPAADEAEGATAMAGLPRIEDERLPAETPTVGSHLPSADLVVMTQLLAITPELVGSRSDALTLRVDENLGYVLHGDLGWQAVFGRYTPIAQPPDVIPQQVQCLEAVLAAEERKLTRVRLVISEDGCGTYSTHA